MVNINPNYTGSKGQSTEAQSYWVKDPESFKYNLAFVLFSAWIKWLSNLYTKHKLQGDENHRHIAMGRWIVAPKTSFVSLPIVPPE